MLARDTTKVAVDPVALSKQLGLTKRRITYIPAVGRLTLGLHGLGDIWDDAQETVTEETKSFFKRLFDDLLSSLGFRTGAEEADKIVPVQNQLMDKLGAITDQIRIPMNPTLDQLYAFVRQIKEYAAYFRKFVADPLFVDGRASAQALNTVMPYIDGTCGYEKFVLQPTAANCLRWGDGTIGGPGTNGMLGALQRAIQAGGGNVDLTPLDPNKLPLLGTYKTAGFSTPLAIGLGLIVLFAYSRRR